MLSLYFIDWLERLENMKIKIFGSWWLYAKKVLKKLLGKIKEIIGIEKFEDSKIWINTDNKLSDEVILKSVAILMNCY